MTIDFHTHVFPDALAPRAIGILSTNSGGLDPQFDGTADGLKTAMATDGVDLSVVLGIATNPKQQTNVNNFANELNQRDEFVGFGSVHPDAEDALCELERIKSMGLKGVKLHPDYQGFCVDEDRMIPIYKKISQLGLITVFHAGYDYGYKYPYGAMPQAMKKALKHFDSPVVVAHWGAAGQGLEVIEHLCGLPVYFDTSFGYGTMPKYMAQTILDKHTPDRLLLGSDMPWHRVPWEKRLIESLDISDSDKEKIYYKNAAELLGIKTTKEE